jgi:heptosyltransferase I
VTGPPLFSVPPRSLLLIKPGSMGDVIHALPVASAIYAAWPQTKVTWIVDPRWAPLLEGNPAVSSLCHFPRGSFKGVAGLAKAVVWYRDLDCLCPEVCVDLQGLLRSALMARFSRAKRVVGLSDAREGASFFFDHLVPVVNNEHAVQRYLRSLPALGIPFPSEPSWVLPEGEPPSGCVMPEEAVVLHPFARGAGKSMDEAAVYAFFNAFRSISNKPLVVVGEGAGFSLPQGVLDLTGKTTLLQLIWILRRSSFVASVDSGPMHLASALARPLLSIHTWSDPRLVGPYGAGAWIWQGGGIRLRDPNEPPWPEVPFTAAASAEIGRFVAKNC